MAATIGGWVGVVADMHPRGWPQPLKAGRAPDWRPSRTSLAGLRLATSMYEPPVGQVPALATRGWPGVDSLDRAQQLPTSSGRPPPGSRKNQKIRYGPPPFSGPIKL